jgi:hypothetical protein
VKQISKDTNKEIEIKTQIRLLVSIVQVKMAVFWDIVPCTEILSDVTEELTCFIIRVKIKRQSMVILVLVPVYENLKSDPSASVGVRISSGSAPVSI